MSVSLLSKKVEKQRKMRYNIKRNKQGEKPMKKLCLFLTFILILSCPVSAEDYQLAYPIADGYARIVKDLKWGLLNDRLESVLPPQWDYLGELAENFRMVRSGTLTGFSDRDGNQVITPQFQQALNFSQGFAAVKNEEGKWGYINQSGELVIPYLYEEANSFSDGLALIKSEGLYGYIDGDNNILIPPSYTEAYPFSEELACVKIDDTYGYINTDGTIAINPQYELAFDFCEGFAVIKNGKYGLIDGSGTPIITPSFDRLSPCVKNGLLKAEIDGKMAFVNTAGQQKTEFIYTDLGDFSEGLCPVRSDNSYGYLNSDFSLVLSPAWELAGNFSEGLAPVKKDGLWGYIDTEGALQTDYIFAEAGTFSEGYAVVCTQDEKWQFLSSDNLPLVTPPEDLPNDIEIETEPNTLLLEIDHNYLYTPNGAVILDAAPIIKDGHTLLPIRAVIEAIGGNVSWDADTQKITMQKDGHIVILQLNKTAAIVDGRITLLEAVPILENDRTLSPLRFAMEALGCTVSWDGETRRISISY
ncbi:MAG: hypothetical protein E7403_05655 [Ruminococcaceae bacterium]|nr:hypothetical protein [Oscillospiraceae bacterium]